MEDRARALAELRIEGVATTIDFHREILQNAVFVQGIIDTGFVDRRWMAK